MKHLALILLFIPLTFISAQINRAELDSIANHYAVNGEINKGIEYLNQIVSDPQLADSLRYTTLLLIGNSYQELYEDELAIENYRKAFNSVEVGSLPYAKLLLSIANSYQYLDQVDSSFALIKEARSIVENKVGKKHLDYAEILVELAGLYKYNYQDDKAMGLYKEANLIQEAVVGKESESYAYSLLMIANIYIEKNACQKALPLLLEVKTIQEAILKGNNSNYTSTLNSLSIVYKFLDDYDKALYYQDKCLQIDEELFGKAHVNYIIDLSNLSHLYEKLGNYSMALSILLEAKDLAIEVYGEDRSNYKELLTNLAFVYKKQKNYKSALQLFLELREIAAQQYGKTHSKYANTLSHLGLIYMDLKEYTLALSYFKEVYEIIFFIDKDDVFAQIVNLHNISNAYDLLEDYKEAIRYSQKRKRLIEEAFGKEHIEYCFHLIEEVYLYKEIEQYAQAWERIEEVIDYYSQSQIDLTFDEELKKICHSTANLSMSHRKSVQKFLDALYYLLDSDATVVNALDKKAFVAELMSQLLAENQREILDEQNALSLFARSNKWLRRSMQYLNRDQRAKAFQLSEQNKSVLLVQATRDKQAYSMGKLPDSLLLRKKDIESKKRQIEAKLLERNSAAEIDRLRTALNKSHRELELFVRELKQKYPQYHQFHYAKIETKAKDIQALLATDAAMIEYFIGDSSVHIFLLTREEIIWKEVVINPLHLKKKIRNFHSSLSDYNAIVQNPKDSYIQYIKQAHWFYQQLLEVVLKDREGIKQLIIIPDGELSHLPFETFLVEAEDSLTYDYTNLSYLLKDYRISYNYSASLWKDNVLGPKQKNNGQLFAIAPDYAIKPSENIALGEQLRHSQMLRNQLKELPLAKKEVEELQKQYKGFFAFDTLATESVVKEKAGAYSIIHFASHGVLNKRHPLLSSLALTVEDVAKESSFLQAYEISKMELNADLVVLSACETGYGRVESGNGVASLARAFMYAGTPALLVSLWQVNDGATSMLMTEFYANLAKGLSKDEALRLAKLSYLSTANVNLGHPALWSPFTVIGNTKEVTLEKNTTGWSFSYYLLFIGGLVIVASLFKALKRETLK